METISELELKKNSVLGSSRHSPSLFFHQSNPSNSLFLTFNLLNVSNSKHNVFTNNEQ
jgi:hypothetical protein